MLRLAGILTGSALAIAVLIATLGLPQLSSTSEHEVTAAPATRDLFVPEDIVGESQDEAADLNGRLESEPGFLPAPAPLPNTSAVAAADQLEQPAPPVSEQIDVVPEPQVTAHNPQPRVRSDNSETQVTASNREPLNWFAFWSPFRSEIAANGFVTELQRTTGLDYRVVKVKPGVYEVAFAYASDTDRQDKLERISAATGLDVSGS